MDVVITYVNGLDPVWQKSYADTVGMDTFVGKRFRDWGTLKYLLRGIQTHMPFVRNVYLVVSTESQVPSWADTDNLRIVCHKDIIPERFLPVFNSTAIEMFLHRIPGLDEQYVYFNDDFYPVSDLTPEDFFSSDKAVMGFSRHLFASGLYKKQTRNSDMMARSALGLNPSLSFIRPQHISSPMLRSQCEEVYAKIEAQILESVSPLREPKNMNQYLFLDYMYHKGRMIRRRMSNKHLSLAASGADKVCRCIENPSWKFLCINDVQMSEEKFLQTRSRITSSFEKKFPHKSRFEK